MSASKLHRLVALLLFASLSACGGGGGGGGDPSDDPKPKVFRVLDTRPFDNEINVNQYAWIDVRFSDRLDTESLVGAVSLTGPDGPVDGTFYLTDDDRTLQMRPSQMFPVATSYTMRLEGTIANTKGATLGEEVAFSFTTSIVPTPRPIRAEDFKPIFGTMSTGRSQHTATLLDDGTVLVTGGFINASQVTGSAEIYDPEDFAFSPLTSAMVNARARHTATKLADGRVLLAGGLANGGMTALGTCDIYNPTQDSFTTTGEMRHVRAYHTANLLPDGRVLVCGGAWFDQDGNWFDLRTAEIFDPDTGTWSELAAEMAQERSFHTATELHDGRILIAGGASDRSAELYDPATEAFTTVTGEMVIRRAGHSAAILDNGVVLLSGGGSARGELYVPALNRFEPTSNMASWDRYYATSTRTLDGGILVLGGTHFGDTNILILASMDHFWQGAGANGSYIHVPLALSVGRSGHTGTVLLDGSTLFCGGVNSDYTQPELSTAFLFRQD